MQCMALYAYFPLSPKDPLRFKLQGDIGELEGNGKAKTLTYQFTFLSLSFLSYFRFSILFNFVFSLSHLIFFALALSL
jgi:hypothetical protein